MFVVFLLQNLTETMIKIGEERERGGYHASYLRVFEISDTITIEISQFLTMLMLMMSNLK